MGRLGAAAWNTRWQRTQASLGRMWRTTLKRPGTYSSCSATSRPISRSRPPHSPQPQAWPAASLMTQCRGVRPVHVGLAWQVLGQAAVNWPWLLDAGDTGAVKLGT